MGVEMAMMLAVLTRFWGLIARHVVLKLPNARFDVRGTVRRQDQPTKCAPPLLRIWPGERAGRV